MFQFDVSVLSHCDITGAVVLLCICDVYVIIPRVCFLLYAHRWC